MGTACVVVVPAVEDASPDGTAGGGCYDGIAGLEKVGMIVLRAARMVQRRVRFREEAPEGELVVAVGCKANTDNDRDEGAELGRLKGAGKEEVRDGHDKERGGGADDLVEGYSDELEMLETAMVMV